MEEMTAALLEEERVRAGDRIAAFAAMQASLVPSEQRALAVSDCFSEPIRVGYDWACSKCSGKGKITCTRCYGMRTVKCNHCQGSGKSNCSVCYGTGDVNCSRCGGQRGWNRQVEHREYNSVTNQYWTRYENVWEHCSSCQGGKVRCSSCSGGKVNCFSCHGSGKVTCDLCMGSGEEKCSGCDGKGYMHRITTTTCDVANAFGVEAGGGDAEVSATAAKWDYATFASLADVAAGQPEVSRAKLVRPYAGRIAFTRARIHCEGEDFVLYGYGAPGQVFDFKGMVTHLLTGDLDQLQKALSAPAGLFATRNKEQLRQSLGIMLRSEVNQQLCDKDRKERLISNGTVTREHADTTVASLRKAMGRLYRLAASIGICGLSAATLVTLYLLYYFYFMLPGRLMKGFAIFVVVMAVSGFAAEFLSRHLTLRGFAAGGPEERKAAARLLQATGTLRRWRLAWGGAVTACIILFFWFMSYSSLLVLPGH
jgi:hypothetical protein